MLAIRFLMLGVEGGGVALFCVTSIIGNNLHQNCNGKAVQLKIRTSGGSSDAASPLHIKQTQEDGCELYPS
jgi:hypothetical protein